MREYLDCLNKYAVFAGRASRREYWMFTVTNAFVAFVLVVLAGTFGYCTAIPGVADIVFFGYALAVLSPGVAVSVRRLHDLGKSGWWLLASALIPFVGAGILFVFFCFPGETDGNRFGECPSRAAHAAAPTGGAAPSPSPVVAGAVGLLAFLLGVAYFHGVFARMRSDLIFGDAIGFFGAYQVLLAGVMCAASGVSMRWNLPVRSKLWAVIWTLGVLEVAFMVHLVVAYAYYGQGMAFVACMRGFTARCVSVFVLMFMAWLTTQVFVVVLFGVRMVRERLERAGLHLSSYRRNCLRLVWWTGLLGLLVYELVLLLTFVSRGWWAGA